MRLFRTTKLRSHQTCVIALEVGVGCPLEDNLTLYTKGAVFVSYTRNDDINIALMQQAAFLIFLINSIELICIARHIGKCIKSDANNVIHCNVKLKFVK